MKRVFEKLNKKMLIGAVLLFYTISLNANDDIDGVFGKFSIDHNWKTISHKSVHNPVVLLTPPTYKETDPVITRLKNISSHGVDTQFSVKLQEFRYQNLRYDNGAHVKRI